MISTKRGLCVVSQVLVYTVTSNGMNSIIIPTIELNESNNHGGYYTMILYNGKILHSYEWTELFIYNYVIKQVKQLYSYEKGPLVKDRYTIFEWESDIPILY